MSPPAISKFVIDAIRELDRQLVQRISQLVVSAEPNAVRFDFVTNLPTSPIVEVFTLAQRDGILFFEDGGAEPLGVAFNFLPNPGSTDHHARLTSLPQGRPCMFRITAGGGAGEPAVVTGTFTTGRRDATVLVREILMWNDGDPGLKGSGELTFYFGLYDAHDHRVDERKHRTSISTGELRNLPFGTAPAMARQGADDWASIYVLGVELDATFGAAYSAPETLPSATTAYENDLEVYVDAMQTVSLPTTPGEHRVGWALHSGPHGIHYDITGWLTVTVQCPPPVHYLALGSAKNSATMNARGTRASVVTTSGKRTEFAISPAGAIAKNVQVRRWQSPEWTILAEAAADAATVVALTEDSALVLTVEHDALTARRVRFDEEGSVSADVISEGVRPQVSRVDSAAGVSAISVIGHAGDARVLLVDASGAAGKPVHVGGSFRAAPALIWLSEETLALCGITEKGDVLAAEVRTEHLSSAEAGDLQWTPLDGEPVIALCTVEDEGNRQLIGLTADRRLLARSRSGDHTWSHWREAGSLDETTPIENEPQATNPAADR